MREYTMTNASGLPMTVQLEDETAKKWDAKPAEKQAPPPKNKARKPANKEG